MPSEDAKPVKKKEESEDEKSLGSILADRKKKHTNNIASSTTKRRSKEGARVKKEEPEDSDYEKPIKVRPKETKVKKEENIEDDDNKPIAKKSSATKHDKIKEVNKTKVKTVVNGKDKKKEKKVYDLPGQKRDPPEERDPLRIFYETLYKQASSSEMAQFWMMESGLLSKEEAKKVFEKKQKRSLLQKLSSPAKAVSVKKTKEATAMKKKTSPSPVASNKKITVSKDGPKQNNKKIENESSDWDVDSDDDFVVNKLAKKKRVA